MTEESPDQLRERRLAFLVHDRLQRAEAEVDRLNGMIWIVAFVGFVAGLIVAFTATMVITP